MKRISSTFMWVATILLLPLFLLYFTAWYILAGRKGHGDIILYIDGVDQF